MKNGIAYTLPINTLTVFKLTLIIVLFLSTAGFADDPKIVTGKIVDIFNDEEAGAAYVTIKSKNGLFIIDCKHKSFETPIAPDDFVKVYVKNVRTMQRKTVGDLVSVIQHIPSKQ